MVGLDIPKWKRESSMWPPLAPALAKALYPSTGEGRRLSASAVFVALRQPVSATLWFWMALLLTAESIGAEGIACYAKTLGGRAAEIVARSPVG